MQRIHESTMHEAAALDLQSSEAALLICLLNLIALLSLSMVFSAVYKRDSLPSLQYSDIN